MQETMDAGNERRRKEWVQIKRERQEMKGMRDDERMDGCSNNK